MRTNLIEVDLQNETRVVEFDGNIDAVRLDGQKLSDIHDLAVKVEHSNLCLYALTKRIKLLAYIATVLAIMAVALCSTIGGWLLSNAGKIEDSLNSNTFDVQKSQHSQVIMGEKLRSLGWEYKGNKWVEIK